MSEEVKEKIDHPVPCPPNPRWVAKMLTVYPKGVAKKLEPYRNCPNVAKEIEKILNEEGRESG
ncbi:hypothetical protein IBX65_08380 [Candidatus Aerophobetes bacterium]|nr:hypothetical protein [Candidatus Aerophobetes bacterium]